MLREPGVLYNLSFGLKRVEDLNRYGPTQNLIHTAINDTHTALADFFDDSIVEQLSTDKWIGSSGPTVLFDVELYRTQNALFTPAVKRKDKRASNQAQRSASSPKQIPTARPPWIQGLSGSTCLGLAIPDSKGKLTILGVFSATMRPQSPAAARSAALAPNEVAKIRSKAVGEPPLLQMAQYGDPSF